MDSKSADKKSSSPAKPVKSKVKMDKPKKASPSDPTKGPSMPSWFKKEQKSPTVSHDIASPDRLSSILDESFPVASTPSSTFVNCVIDPLGFSSIAFETYNTVVSEDSSLAEDLSTAEFMLVCGWMLARRVLKIREHSFGEEVDADALFKAIPETVPIPGPVSMALQAIGECKSPSGPVIVPELILPRIDPTQPYLTGMEPSRSSEGYRGITDPRYMNSMFHYGLLKRKIRHERGNADGYGDNWNTRWNPGAAAIGDDDYLVAVRRKFLPGMNGVFSSDRERAQSAAPIFNGQGLLGSVCFNGAIFRSYLSFMDKAKKYMSCSPMTKELTGGNSLAGFVLGTQAADLAPTQYRVFASHYLDLWEMHAVRIFKWRREVPPAQDCWADGRGRFRSIVDSWNGVSIRVAEITAISDNNAMIRYFVRSFVVTQVV